MSYLITGLILFLGIHSLAIISPTGRQVLRQRLGRLPYQALYSLIALVGLVLIIHGWGQARLDPVVLYHPPGWLTHVNNLLMLLVFPLLLAAYLPGRIQRTFRHPMLVAVKTWALAHLLVNGELAALLLFGSFLAWAVVDRISLKRRTQSDLIQLPAWKFNDLIVVIAGLGLHVIFVFWLHPLWIGVPAVPG
ncbi:NnrU family protein [Wenzhouxiangella sp. AB-CW3]|uniref:NnrU family protein n=1 Tax=Wenzhouxiangella sp. AB-CW3 TaxID=2771012 RepID=UPI00168BB26F|nr:NnrU family protein [Wenzhouxiangella sp. AB-CW3]QOC23188.1 NnrU family protein [Wenzhouxiangella sp. AB-CW3]